MGNNHSQEHHRRKGHSNRSKHHQNSVPVSPVATPPELSRSSSISHSRPTSVMDDVRVCVQKMLGKSQSTVDVTLSVSSGTSNRGSYNRSTSAPTELASTDSNANSVAAESELHNSGQLRSYQTSNSKYCFPTDEIEQDRLTNTHYVLKHCFGENFSAPVHDLLSRSVSVARDSNSTLENVSSSSASSVQLSKNTPARVLDIACGSGVWVLDMATNFPNSQFYGIDRACIFPTTIKPPNTTFQQCDVLDTEGLPFPDEFFDYIHMRLVYNCFSKSDLKFVLQEINRVLKPGGYVELRDIDPTIKNPGPATDKYFSDFAVRMAQLHDVDVTWTQDICSVLSNEGELTDIHHQKVSVGFGRNGSLTQSMNCSISDAIKSYKQFFMEAYDISSDECDERIQCIIEESSKHHSHFNYYMSWGRKSLALVTRNGTDSPMVPLTPISTEMRMDFPPRNNSDNSNPVSCTPSSMPLPMQSVMIENAFDIVQFANGFTE